MLHCGELDSKLPCADWPVEGLIIHRYPERSVKYRSGAGTRGQPADTYQDTIEHRIATTFHNQHATTGVLLRETRGSRTALIPEYGYQGRKTAGFSQIRNHNHWSAVASLLPPPPPHQLGHQILAGPLRRLGVEIRDQPVPEHRRRHGLDVVKVGDCPAVHRRPRLGAQHQVLRRPRAGAPLDVFLDERRRLLVKEYVEW